MELRGSSHCFTLPVSETALDQRIQLGFSDHDRRRYLSPNSRDMKNKHFSGKCEENPGVLKITKNQINHMKQETTTLEICEMD